MFKELVDNESKQSLAQSPYLLFIVVPLFQSSQCRYQKKSTGAVLLCSNNNSVWLESKCPGTEQNRRRTSHSKRELYFSEVVVEVSCQKPSVARFWQAVTKTEEKESSLEECKVSLRFWMFQDHYFSAIQIPFFLILEIVPTISLILEEFCAILGIALTCEAQPSHL